MDIEEEKPLRPHKSKGTDLENENNQGKVETGDEKIIETNQPWVGGMPNLATSGKTDK